jgi:hypothetical protein
MREMTIRNIIKRGQELICSLEVQRLVNIVHRQDGQLEEDGKRIAFLCGSRKSYCWPTYPQSLGELGLEFMQGTLLSQKAGTAHKRIGIELNYQWEPGKSPSEDEWREKMTAATRFRFHHPSDGQAVRVAMYHKEARA